MKLFINKTDLMEAPCPDYDDLPEYFDAIEEIQKRGNRYSDVRWLIAHCRFAQTKDLLEYYISLNPDYSDVLWLIAKCEFARKYLKIIKC